VAGRGPAPKPKDQRRRRNADPVATTVLRDDGVVRGPSLEELTGRRFSADAERWFEGWRRAPQAAAFISTDWQRLGMLAPLVERYWERPSAATASEIRLNEERLGATVVDRQRARMVVEDSEEAPVLEIVDKRRQIEERLRGE
jgi:hypothetical protein